VKEQRVYGNLNGKYIPFLICTLVHFERNSQFKIPFKSINNFRLYNSISTQQSEIKLNMLNAYFVTGISDAESSFVIRIYQDNKYKTGWVVTARFQIAFHKKDLVLLELIKNHFKVGNIYKQDADSMQYRVSSVKDLANVIIPHFDKYPLITQKQADYILFKKIVDLMSCKEHLTKEGIQKIVNIRSSMNLGLSAELKTFFLEVVPVKRPVIQDQIILDPAHWWAAGFASGFPGLYNIIFIYLFIILIVTLIIIFLFCNIWFIYGSIIIKCSNVKNN